MKADHDDDSDGNGWDSLAPESENAIVVADDEAGWEFSEDKNTWDQFSEAPSSFSRPSFSGSGSRKRGRPFGITGSHAYRRSLRDQPFLIAETPEPVGDPVAAGAAEAFRKPKAVEIQFNHCFSSWS